MRYFEDIFDIMEFTSKIDCDRRHPVTYIRDRNDEFWKHKRSLGFRMVQLKDHYFRQRMTLPKLESYEVNLLHYEGPRPHRQTIIRDFGNTARKH